MVPVKYAQDIYYHKFLTHTQIKLEIEYMASQNSIKSVNYWVNVDSHGCSRC